MMRKDVGAMEVETMSLAPRVAAELLKINRLLELGNRPLNKNGRRRIGPTQGRILTFLLSRSPDHITLSGLAKGVALSPATASEAVRGLSSKGFVRKSRSRDDARIVFLSLSAAGRRKSEQAAAGSHHLNAAIERLTSREQELVLHTLKNIQQAMNLREKKP
jgi:DNA-binding MarR family transcriptional regulator